MALTGLQIQKLLPKTNCKECGSNTCLAFAMKLANKKADLSQCPYASEEAKLALGAASEPPVRGVALGKDKSLKLGEETVLYRHDRTFVHQTAIAVNVNDTDAASATDATLNAVKSYLLERVGEKLVIDAVGVSQRCEEASGFVDLCRKAYEVTGKPVVVRGKTTDAVRAAAVALAGSHSLLVAPDEDSADALALVAKEHGHALAITAPDVDRLFAVADRIKKTGFNDLVLMFQTHSLAEQFQTNSIARRAAIRDNVKPMGYAMLRFVGETRGTVPFFANDREKGDSPLGADALDATAEAATEIDKYGGIIVLPTFDPAQLAPLMTLRQNIYTDPQKPIQVEPKVYPIGEPNENSPVFLTTNFSLTYFIVSGEIENAGISAWLVVPECEGMSVLTAWAAGKFSGGSIAKFCKEIGLDNQVKTRKIVIPGYVAQISGELEEGLPGWQVLVGPAEAADLESFIKARVSA
jgi:acetyl-CoA decarbonylase/synthase complex subunit gamma